MNLFVNFKDENREKENKQLDNNSDSLNLLPSSFNFDLNLSKETLQFVNQFAQSESRFNPLSFDTTTTTTSSNGVDVGKHMIGSNNSSYSNETAINSVNSANDNHNHHHQRSNGDTHSNKSSNGIANNPLLSCSGYNNESDDETNWESLL